MVWEDMGETKLQSDLKIKCEVGVLGGGCCDLRQ